MFVSKDPRVVLRDSTDGNARYKALAALREPVQNGGTQQDQDAVFEILQISATSDQQPLCRMAAVRTGGHFKDPRAAEVLESVYLQNLPFGQEMNGHLRQQCLTSLAETGGPVALRRLVLVAKEPPANGSEADKLETLDRRLTAVRGLAKFKEPEAAAALAAVVASEKDSPLRDRAHESLQAWTGKRLPLDSPQFQSLANSGTTVIPAGGVSEQKKQ
jgi:hypothetical protein